MSPKLKKIIAAIALAIITAVAGLVEQWGEAPVASPEESSGPTCFDTKCCPPGKESPMFLELCACRIADGKVECIADGGVFGD